MRGIGEAREAKGLWRKTWTSVAEATSGLCAGAGERLRVVGSTLRGGMQVGARSCFAAGFGMLGALALILICTARADAYDIFEDQGGDNCAQCHGGFRDSPYISPRDGSDWGDDLHDVIATPCWAVTATPVIPAEISPPYSSISPMAAWGWIRLPASAATAAPTIGG
jgi:hypothetical protein